MAAAVALWAMAVSGGLARRIRASATVIASGAKIPWGVDSGRSCCQTEVAKPLTLEAIDVT
jgi:hypothetical protein